MKAPETQREYKEFMIGYFPSKQSALMTMIKLAAGLLLCAESVYFFYVMATG